ncbi:MAG: TlpA family protein disulfide reductase [Elusimicrobia bacterium]|nr:TlpA family protein disulfide reductase [Elusimicrobiota bacterium]
MPETKKQGNKVIKEQAGFCFLIFLFSCFLVPCLYCADLGIDVGNESINFSLRQVSSTETFKLSDYKTKNPVLLSFFATWCPSCVREIPELSKIYKEYNKKGLEIVSVNVQENEEKVTTFMRRKNISHKVLLDINAGVTKEFKVYGIPTNILINTEGIIVFRGYDLPAEKEIEKVLIKPKKKSKKRRKWEEN